MSEKVILEAKNLSKSYGNIPALNDFSLSVAEGEIVALLGPNGAGKTTFISILSGTLDGFTGSVHFRGHDLFRNRRFKDRIGIVPQDMAFYEELNARDNLSFFARLYGMAGEEIKSRIGEILEMVELDTRAREPVKNFSGGMKRRLNLALGMLHRPELLLLDEPTVGIDVQAKIRILDIIQNAAGTGTAAIFTTHQLAEVEKIGSRIIVMDKGSILAQGTLEELIRIVGEKEIVTIEGEFALECMQSLLGEDPFYDVLAILDNRVELAFQKSDLIPRLIERFFTQKIPVHDVRIKSPNLETLFLKLTGRSLRD